MGSYRIETQAFRRQLAEKDFSAYLTRQGMSYVEIAGHSIRIRSLGKGAKTIVFAADSPIIIEHHDRLFEILSDKVRVICIDVPGFGFSAPKEDFDFGLSSFTDVLEELLFTLGHDDYVLSFPCFTSYMAMQLAERMPEKISYLVMPQAPDWQGELQWFTDTSGLGILKTQGLGQWFMTTIQKHAPWLWLQPWFMATVNEEKAREKICQLALEAANRGMINCWASIYQAWHAMPEPNFSQVKQAGLSIWGPKDLTHLRSKPHSITQCMPHLQCHTFEHSAHYTYLQEPERFAKLLLSQIGVRQPAMV